MLKSYRFAYVLPLLLALAHPGGADATPSSSSSSHSSSSHSSSSHSSSSHSSSSRSSSSSFKSGFSSQRSSSSSATPSYAPSKPSGAPAASDSAGGAGRSGGFGSFGRRPAGAAAANDAPDAAPGPGRSSGGFGSFGGGQPVPQKSDSALSRQLGRKAAEENALRTLDARRQAQADAARDTRPVPGYEGSGQGAQRGQGQPAPGYAQPQPQPQAPVVVRQDSGLGQVVAGAVLANAMRGAHAHNNGYPGGYGNGGGRSSHGGGGISFVGLFMTLCVLALLAWGAYFVWRRLRRAREDKKPNYSFREN